MILIFGHILHFLRLCWHLCTIQVLFDEYSEINLSFNVNFALALREPADIGVSLCESEYISPPSATPVHVTAKISFVRHVSLFPAAAS